jgi:glycosyltransferase involved in cell wall biosynthesis
MTVAGICICKDEADIIRITIEHMLTQVDRVYVLDNMSTDGTTDILRYLFAEHRGRMFWGIDKEPAYYQSRKMTELAHRVHDLDQSIDWIVPFDADEIWTSGWAPRLADRLQVLGNQWLVVQADLYDYVCTGRDLSTAPDPVHRIQYRVVDPLPLPKVACRWRKDLVIDHGNHRGLYDESGATVSHDRLIVRHFPYRSPEQFVRKVRNGAAAYKLATELPDPTIGSHWRGYGQILESSGEQALIDNVFRPYFYEPDPFNVPADHRQLIHDPAILGAQDHVGHE